MLFLWLAACSTQTPTLDDYLDDLAEATCKNADRCADANSWFELDGGREACEADLIAQYESAGAALDCLYVSSAQDARACLRAVRRQPCEDTGLFLDDCFDVILFDESCTF